MPQADRTRLAARIPADYLGFGYAPLLPDDMRAVAQIGQDVAAAPPLLDADNALIAADLAATRVERVAASSSASAAAGMVTATADRATGRRLNDVDLWSVIRATPSWNFGPDGVLVEAPADTLAWEFDLATGAPQGVAFAGSRSNLIRNPRAEGAVAGTPGTLPTLGWSLTDTGTHLRRIVGTGSEAGIPYIDVEWTVSPGATALGLAFADTPAASGGVVHAGSCWLRVVSGTPPQFRFVWQDGINTFNQGFFSVATTLTRYVSNFTTSIGTTLARCMIGLDASAGGAVFTLRIGGMQLEAGLYPSAPILPPVGTPGMSTRAQGAIDIPVWRLGHRYNRRQGVLIVEWNSLPGPFSSAADTDALGLFSLGDTSAGEVMGLVVNPAHSLVEMRRLVGGVAQSAASCVMTPPAAGQRILCAMAWDLDAGLMQAAARGAVGTQLTGQTSIPIITHAMPGRFSTTRPLFGRITGAEIRPAAAFGNALAAMT